MSKVETQVDDPKKLALRCKTLELQLRQSVSKKEHHEITSKLEKQVDSLERDLDRARVENQKTIAINKQIAGVEGLISSLIKTANSQGKTLDFIEEEASTRGKALTAQGKVLDTLATKLSQGTVPSNVHLQALSKIRDLEEDKRGMVRRFDYNSLEGRCAELSRQLATMVPSSDYSSLKEKFDEATKQMENMVPASDYSALKQRAEELEGAISSMVPREQFASSEARVSELEARLAEHVPQSIYDELVSRVVSLAEAVTGGAVQPEETRAEPQPEAVAEPLAQAIAEPQPEAVAEPLAQAIAEPLAQAIAEPQPEAVAEPLAQAIAEPLAQAIAEPQPEAVAEPLAQAITEPQPEVVEVTAPEPAAPVAADVVATNEVTAPEAPAQAAETIAQAITEPQPEAIATEPVAQVAPVAAEVVAYDIGPEQPTQAAEPSPQVEAPVASAPAVADSTVPEIREVASQLAEINSQAQEAQGEDAAIGEATTEEPPAQVAPPTKDALVIEAIAQETESA